MVLSARLIRKLNEENTRNSLSRNFIQEHLQSPTLSIALFNLIEEQVNNKDTYNKILPAAEQHMDEFLRKKLPAHMPMITMFIGDKTINDLKALFMTELEVLVPEIMQDYINSSRTDTVTQQKLQSKLHEMAEHTIKPLIIKQVKKAGPKITAYALVFGIIAGILQAFILNLVI